MALPGTALMYRTSGAGSHKKVQAKRFCIDDPVERAEFEKLATDHANGLLHFIGEQSEIYSQKEDRLYIFVKWMES